MIWREWSRRQARDSHCGHCKLLVLGWWLYSLSGGVSVSKYCDWRNGVTPRHDTESAPLLTGGLSSLPLESPLLVSGTSISQGLLWLLTAKPTSPGCFLNREVPCLLAPLFSPVLGQAYCGGWRGDLLRCSHETLILRFQWWASRLPRSLPGASQVLRAVVQMHRHDRCDLIGGFSIPAGSWVRVGWTAELWGRNKGNWWEAES